MKNFIKLKLCLLTLIVTCLLSVTAFAEVTVPTRDGYVTDIANKLSSSDEKKLEAKLKSYHKSSKKNIAILIVPSLASVKAGDIEDVGYAVGNSWGIGGEKSDDGVLVTVSIKDRKVRIDTGKGIEGDLTDSECSDIIHDIITPYFKKKQIYKGLDRAVGAIAHELSPKSQTAVTPKDQKNSGPPTWVVLLIIFIIFLVILWVISRSSGGSSGDGGGFTFGGSSSSGNFDGFDGDSRGGDFGGGGAGGDW